VIPIPKWTAIRPHARATLPCSSTLYLSFPETDADQTPKVRLKCGLDGDGPVLTLDLLDGGFPKFSRVTGVSHLFHCPTKQAATFFAKEMENLSAAFELFHGPGAGRRSRVGRHMTLIPTMAQQAWGFYAEDSEDIPALLYAVLMSLRQDDEIQDVHNLALRPLLYSVAGDLRDPLVAAEEDALKADSLAYAAMSENGKRLHAAGEARAAQELLNSIVA